MFNAMDMVGSKSPIQARLPENSKKSAKQILNRVLSLLLLVAHRAAVMVSLVRNAEFQASPRPTESEFAF